MGWGGLGICVFVYLCICVCEFVYLCVFLYLCICILTNELHVAITLKNVSQTQVFMQHLRRLTVAP